MNKVAIASLRTKTCAHEHRSQNRYDQNYDIHMQENRDKGHYKNASVDNFPLRSTAKSSVQSILKQVNNKFHL